MKGIVGASLGAIVSGHDQATQVKVKRYRAERRSYKVNAQS